MLRRSRRTAVPALALAAVAAPVAAAPAQASTDKVERQVVRLINAKRHHIGKGSMHLSGRMSVGASRHSIKMARSGTMAHGSSWLSRVRKYARTRTVGEVIAYVHAPASYQARWVYNAWMHSPEHRAVIMSGRFDRAGIGRHKRGNTTFFTLDTAR